MRRRVLVLLLVVSALHVGANAAWLWLDEGVQFTDAAYHYSQTIELREALLGGPEELAALPDQDERQRYGFVWYGVAASVSLLTGPAAGPLLTGLSALLWPALIFGAFVLGAELAPPDRRETAGVLSALLAGTIPGIFNYSRVLVLDLPLAVAVLWAAWLLVRLLSLPEGSSAKRRTAWLAGGVTLVAVGIKVNALAFLIGPAWVALRPTLGRLWRQDRGRLLAVLGVTSAVGAAVGAWLLLGSRGEALVETFTDATWPGKALDYRAAGTLADYPGDWARGAWSHSWQVAYFTIIQTLTPPILAVTVLAYSWYFGRRRGCQEPIARAQRDAMFWWWLVPVAGLLLLLRGLYDERYIVPLLPQAAALIAVALVELPWPGVRRLLVTLVLAGSLTGFAFVSFDFWPAVRPLSCADVPGWTTDARVGGDLWLCLAYPDYRFMDRPTVPARENWGLERLEAELLPERERLGEPLRAVFLDDLYGLFYRMFQRDLHRGDLLRHQDMLLVTDCWDRDLLASMHGSVEALSHTIRQADVVFVRWGGPAAGDDQAVRGRRCRIGWNDDGGFALAGSTRLTDGTSLRWYLNRRERPPNDGAEDD
jgi:hypothetical protein